MFLFKKKTAPEQHICSGSRCGNCLLGLLCLLCLPLMAQETHYRITENGPGIDEEGPLVGWLVLTRTGEEVKADLRLGTANGEMTARQSYSFFSSEDEEDQSDAAQVKPRPEVFFMELNNPQNKSQRALEAKARGNRRLGSSNIVDLLFNAPKSTVLINTDNQEVRLTGMDATFHAGGRGEREQSMHEFQHDQLGLQRLTALMSGEWKRALYFGYRKVAAFNPMTSLYGAVGLVITAEPSGGAPLEDNESELLYQTSGANPGSYNGVSQLRAGRFTFTRIEHGSRASRGALKPVALNGLKIILGGSNLLLLMGDGDIFFSNDFSDVRLFIRQIALTEDDEQSQRKQQPSDSVGSFDAGFTVSQSRRKSRNGADHKFPLAAAKHRGWRAQKPKEYQRRGESYNKSSSPMDSSPRESYSRNSYSRDGYSRDSYSRRSRSTKRSNEGELFNKTANSDENWRERGAQQQQRKQLSNQENGTGFSGQRVVPPRFQNIHGSEPIQQHRHEHMPRPATQASSQVVPVPVVSAQVASEKKDTAKHSFAERCAEGIHRVAAGNPHDTSGRKKQRRIPTAHTSCAEDHQQLECELNKAGTEHIETMNQLYLFSIWQAEDRPKKVEDYIRKIQEVNRDGIVEIGISQMLDGVTWFYQLGKTDAIKLINRLSGSGAHEFEEAEQPGPGSVRSQPSNFGNKHQTEASQVLPLPAREEPSHFSMMGMMNSLPQMPYTDHRWSAAPVVGLGWSQNRWSADPLDQSLSPPPGFSGSLSSMSSFPSLGTGAKRTTRKR